MQTLSLALRANVVSQSRLGSTFESGTPRPRTAASPVGPALAWDASPIIFIVDDDPSVRNSLPALLDRDGWRCETFASAEAFLSRPPIAVPNCLISEVELPDLGGLELQARVASRDGGATVIFVSKIDAAAVCVRAMKAGAVDFLTKPIDHEALIEGVSRAIEQSATALRRRIELDQLRARHASLSRREREVMELVVAGLLNKQVGGELGISDVTVKAHRGRMMTKMKAKSFADLVKMSIRLRSTPA